ncbi:hypothetical protein [Pseudomonas umsongensis]
MAAIFSMLSLSASLACLAKAATTAADATKQIIHNSKFGEIK